MTRYFKAVTKDNRVAVRSTTSREYATAFVHDGPQPFSNWASAGNTPPEAGTHRGQLCDAVQISPKEYRELKASGNVR